MVDFLLYIVSSNFTQLFLIKTSTISFLVPSKIVLYTYLTMNHRGELLYHAQSVSRCLVLIRCYTAHEAWLPHSQRTTVDSRSVTALNAGAYRVLRHRTFATRQALRLLCGVGGDLWGLRRLERLQMTNTYMVYSFGGLEWMKCAIKESP